jgi:segregation and condensation protein A
MALEVHLEMFEGPLDLLLFLIKKNDLDIYNIPISQITKEYLVYLELMKELNLEMAGEFLVLAATLMAIKAKTLLPSQEAEENEGPDPRAELVAKLVEYQKFKQAAAFLEKRADEFKDVFYRGVPTFDESEKSLSISMFDLMDALREVLDRAEDADKKEVLGEEFPIEEKIAKIMHLLQRASSVSWEEIFADERKRRGIISCFLALLELTKLQKIFIRQDENFGKITIFKKEAPSDAPSANDAPAPTPH